MVAINRRTFRKDYDTMLISIFSGFLELVSSYFTRENRVLSKTGVSVFIKTFMNR